MSTQTFTFPRGIHPPEGKSFAENNAIEILPTPKKLFLAVQQHIGAPCAPVVKLKDAVEPDAVVASADAFVSAPIHAPFAGTVGRPAKKTLPNGRRVATVALDVDLDHAPCGEDILKIVSGGDWQIPADFDASSIFNAVKTGGLVGMGGAAFPTHVKIAKNEKKPIDTILINGCECEPYLTADYRLMLEFPQPIVVGAILTAAAVGAKTVYICIEDNKPAAIQIVSKTIEKISNPFGVDVSVRVMKTKYPQGGEKQLIRAALGRKVPFPGLPMDVGALVENVSTAAAVAGRVLRGKALTHRIVSVTGGGVVNPKNLFVPIGTPISELIEFCGGLKPDANRILMGGPMMGFAVGTTDIPVTKGTSGITILTNREVKKSVETNCVRCGRCVGVCPMNLIPTKLALASRFQNTDVLQAYHVTACIECGSCAFTCPASLPLVQLIRTGKIQVQKLSKK